MNIKLISLLNHISNTKVSNFITSVDVNALSLAASAISAGFLMRQYIKYSEIHYNNITTSPNFNRSELPRLNMLRMRGFVVFSALTVPAILFINPTIAQKLKNTFGINILLNNLSTSLSPGSQSINTSGLLVFLSNRLKKFKNNRPEVIILLISIFSIFLYYYLSIATNLPVEKYLNIYLLIMSPVFIFICILSLYLLHYFKKNPFWEIPEIFPKFIFSYLDDLKFYSKNDLYFNYCKDILYFLLFTIIIIYLLVIYFNIF